MDTMREARLPHRRCFAHNYPSSAHNQSMNNVYSAGLFYSLLPSPYSLLFGYPLPPLLYLFSALFLCT